MPRVSDAEKQKSHKRILEAAAHLFRENGIEPTSLAEVMKAAGMTHGGFYRHFSGKDDLVGAAFRHSVDEAVAEMEQAAEAGNGTAARGSYVEAYLSREHVGSRGVGCPLAALGSELVRTDGVVKSEARDAVDRVASLLQDKGDDGAGYARLALLVGAVQLARLVDDTEISGDILSAAKRFLDRAGGDTSN